MVRIHPCESSSISNAAKVHESWPRWNFLDRRRPTYHVLNHAQNKSPNRGIHLVSLNVCPHNLCKIFHLQTTIQKHLRSKNWDVAPRLPNSAIEAVPDRSIDVRSRLHLKPFGRQIQRNDGRSREKWLRNARPYPPLLSRNEGHFHLGHIWQLPHHETEFGRCRILCLVWNS